MTVAVGSRLDDYRTSCPTPSTNRVVAWTAEAEAQQRFARQLIEHLGSSGVFSAKWTDEIMPDVGKLVELCATPP
jgi:hypothetical protein